MAIAVEDLQCVTDRASLFTFLRDQLRWPVDPDDTFTYEGPHLEGAVAARADVSEIVRWSAGDPFTIMLVEFRSVFRRTDMREILRKMREQMRMSGRYDNRSLDEIIFVCATEDYTGIRFAHFESRDTGLPRLRVFGYEREQADETRTIREFNLPAIAMPLENVLGEPNWQEGRARWMKAWDVESVTGAFFKRYREVFNDAQAHITGIEGEPKRLFTQRLFNRLLFIRFLEKKGWLTIGGRRDYLRALWDDYQVNRAVGVTNFYTSRLSPLFFAALNEPHVRDHEGNSSLSVVVGDVPYLNGGLFDNAEDLKVASQFPDIVVDDEAIREVVADFFYAYNFTVTESTPDDIEVAVDPEMLGKVFEELVTAGERHDSGSYYTPRGIVSFMCRESLKGFLGGHAELVDERKADNISKKQATDLIAKLKAIKVVDPAGGSGAYILGMLHELFDLIGLLEVRADPMTPKDKYKRKLEIIQNCLYAVDKDEFAVNIARLRLWLSLAVEFEGTEPEPLPNLDFKVECGDSLSAPDPQGGPQPDIFRQKDIEEFDAKKSQYANPYFRGDKVALKKEILALRTAIAKWAHPREDVQGFDWRAEFAEVFQEGEPIADIGGAMNFGGTLTEPPRPGGFDIVLANPPYVRQELIKDQKPTLKKVYPEVYTGTADLYVFFYARAIQLLRPGGMLAFISPSNWFRLAYGANLRKHIADTCQVESVTDFGDLPVFQTASTYPMIFVAKKGANVAGPRLTLVKTLSDPYPDVREIVNRCGQSLPASAINGAEWSLASGKHAMDNERSQSSGTALREYVGSRIYRGLTTGLNGAFVIDRAVHDRLIQADPRNADIIKPGASGRNVGRWTVASPDSWLIVTKIGVDMARYPAVLEHLRQWQTELEVRSDKGNFWWELRACTYYDVFDKQKIVSTKISGRPTFALDSSGLYFGNTAYMLPIDTRSRFVLGILNSDAFHSYARQVFAEKLNGWYEVQPNALEAFRVPDATDEEAEAVEVLVQKCLDAKGVGCEEWEREIDERVAALYGL